MNSYDVESLHYLAASAEGSPIVRMPTDLTVADFGAQASVASKHRTEDADVQRAPYPSVYVLHALEE